VILNELSKRILVSIAGIPLAILIIYTGGWVFTSAIAVISSIGLWELFSMIEKKEVNPYKKFGITVNILLIFLVYGFMQQLSSDSIEIWIVILLSVMMIIIITLLISLFGQKPNSLLNSITTIGGIFYISFTFLSLIVLRDIATISLIYDNSLSGIQSFLKGREPELILSILISIWICDSAAYFTGKSIGKHKLFLSVSPKKTWEGAIGGFLGAIISFVAASNIPLLLDGFPFIYALTIGIIIGTIGQIGDLAESKLKRDAKVKDSSSIIPGHGGILDRFDSIMFVFPVVTIYLFIISVVN